MGMAAYTLRTVCRLSLSNGTRFALQGPGAVDLASRIAQASISPDWIFEVIRRRLALRLVAPLE